MQVLRLGDTGAAVRTVRSALVSLELMAPATDDAGRVDAARADTFDLALDRAVRRFQQERGLMVDGRVGGDTWRELEGAKYQLGMRTLIYRLASPMTGDDVAQLQQRLLELGYDAGRHDGSFGEQTHFAVCTFQGDYGLDADGICGPETAAALRTLTIVRGRSAHPIREQEAMRRSGPRLRGKRIVIDPGHGGDDAGAVGHDALTGAVREADVVWEVANLVEGRMTATGMETMLTRGREANPSTAERAALANRWGADLVLSLHADGQRTERANGVATFHFGALDGQSSTVGEQLARLVQRELVARTGLLDGRSHARTWDLLRGTRMPAVHIELGYLTHPTDRAYLARHTSRAVIAEALVVAVKRLYLMGHDDQPTGTFTFDELLAAEIATG